MDKLTVRQKDHEGESTGVTPPFPLSRPQRFIPEPVENVSVAYRQDGFLGFFDCARNYGRMDIVGQTERGKLDARDIQMS